MAEPTEADRERAASLLPDHQTWCQTVGHGDCCARDPWDCDCGTEEFRDAVAHALADERERARAPFLRLAQDLYDPTKEDESKYDPGYYDVTGNMAAAWIRRAAEETGQ